MARRLGLGLMDNLVRLAATLNGRVSQSKLLRFITSAVRSAGPALPGTGASPLVLKHTCVSGMLGICRW